MDDVELWEKHRHELIRFAAVLAGPSEAEDVVSTIFIRILGRRISDLEHARAYLFRSVLNECRSRTRRRGRLAGLADLPVPPPPEPQPEVLAAVLALPVRQRAATYLVYWADLSIAEAATRMGASPGAVKRYLHLARQKLKEVLDDH
jgi:RNA polymerase sigma-70 factor (ECF subfamily)